MITIGQCRAARGLLDWTQQDLAEASGLSKTAINNFEKGHSDIKGESLRAIRMAFESADIEFMENDGLRKKSEMVQVLRGPTAFAELLDDIYETLKDRGGEILMAHIGESTLRQATPKKLMEHMERLRRNHITERLICADGAENLMAGAAARRLPAEMLQSAMPTFIYEGKVAFELWDKSMIIVIASPEACKAERMRFEHLWQAARQFPAEIRKTVGR